MKNAFGRIGRVGRIILVLGLLVACSCARLCWAEPYDTNGEMGALADESGYLVWPMDPIADSYTVTNYSGGSSNTITISAGADFLFATNPATGASFTLFQNSHFRIQDQYGTVIKSGTNGVFSVLGTNGVGMVLSNGNLSLISNGVPWGTITAANIGGTNGAYTTTNQVAAAIAAAEAGVTNWLLGGPGIIVTNIGGTNCVLVDTNFVATVAWVNSLGGIGGGGLSQSQIEALISSYGGTLFQPVGNYVTLSQGEGLWQPLGNYEAASINLNAWALLNPLSFQAGASTNAIAPYGGVGTNTTIYVLFAATNIDTRTINGVGGSFNSTADGVQIASGTGYVDGTYGGVAIASQNFTLSGGGGQGIGEAIIAGENSAIGVFGANYSANLAGNVQTNYGTGSLVIGNGVVNTNNNVLIAGDGSALISSTTNDQAIFWYSNGVAIHTNTSAGYALNVNGPANFTQILVNGTPLSGSGSQTPWTAGVNGAGNPLTNVAYVGDNANGFRENFANNLNQLQFFWEGSEQGFLGFGQGAYLNGATSLELSDVTGGPVELEPALVSGHGGFNVDQAGDVTGSNVFAAGNLAVLHSSFLNSTNLMISGSTFVGTPNGSGAISFGLIPLMTATNAPFGSAFSATQGTNAWAAFATNSPGGLWPAPAFENLSNLYYTFPAQVTVTSEVVLVTLQLPFSTSVTNIFYGGQAGTNSAPALFPLFTNIITIGSGTESWGFTNTFAAFQGNCFGWAWSGGNNFYIAGNGGAAAGPSFQLYGSGVYGSGTVAGEIVPDTFASRFGVQIISPNGVGINTNPSVGLALNVAGSAQVQGNVSAAGASIAGVVNAQAFELNGQPVNFSFYTNTVILGWWITNNPTLQDQSTAASGYWGSYHLNSSPGHTPYLTNDVNGWGVIPQGYTNNSGAFPGRNTWLYQYGILCTNILALSTNGQANALPSGIGDLYSGSAGGSFLGAYVPSGVTSLAGSYQSPIEYFTVSVFQSTTVANSGINTNIVLSGAATLYITNGIIVGYK